MTISACIRTSDFSLISHINIPWYNCHKRPKAPRLMKTSPLYTLSSSFLAYAKAASLDMGTAVPVVPDLDAGTVVSVVPDPDAGTVVLVVPDPDGGKVALKDRLGYNHFVLHSACMILHDGQIG